MCIHKIFSNEICVWFVYSNINAFLCCTVIALRIAWVTRIDNCILE